MKWLWTDLYSRVKDQRYGSLYLLALMVVFGFWLGTILLDQLYHETSREIREAIGVAVAILLLVVVVRGVMDFRARRRQRREANYSRLSSDELAKARSKLRKNRNRNGA